MSSDTRSCTSAFPTPHTFPGAGGGKGSLGEFVALTSVPWEAARAQSAGLKLISAFHFLPNDFRRCWASCTIVTQSSVLLFPEEKIQRDVTGEVTE